MTQPIQKFVEQVLLINEPEYGNFARVANVYLCNLQKESERMGLYDLEPKFEEMQSYLQVRHNWNIGDTKTRLLKDALYIDNMLMAHKQDWETAPNYF